MTESTDQGPERPRRWLVLSTLGLALLIAGVWLWRDTAQRQPLDDRRRVEMYRRALESVRSVCVQPKSSLESYCRDQATLLLDYPECDPACVALARKVRGEPTR